jgi:hypothetical protein
MYIVQIHRSLEYFEKPILMLSFKDPPFLHSPLQTASPCLAKYGVCTLASAHQLTKTSKKVGRFRTDLQRTFSFSLNLAGAVLLQALLEHLSG